MGDLSIDIPQRDSNGRWCKGFSGNKLGRPSQAGISQLIKGKTNDCENLVNVLLNVVHSEEANVTVANRLKAVELLLNYSVGKPIDLVGVANLNNLDSEDNNIIVSISRDYD